MQEDTFFDAHMHAFNLSHPYFLAFIRRYKGNVLALLVVAGLASIVAHIPVVGRPVRDFLERFVRRITNLLAVMENDIGSFFLLTEDCLREEENPLLTDEGFRIGDGTYSRIVLTPLMIDFGRKRMKDDPDIHYGRPSEKPIVAQVIDVFSGVRKYVRSDSSGQLRDKYPRLTPNTTRVLEIYPFLGLNTWNYDKARIQDMLDKYFGQYTGSRDDLSRNMGRFEGNVEDLGSNSFAGIKVYPPLGFDPWPGVEKERDKVRLLYSYCSLKGIPITAHGSMGGFVAVGRPELGRLTRLHKWQQVLGEYPELKLNLAHFPMKEKVLWVLPDPRHKRRHAFLQLILKNENVYVDFSNRATTDRYYKALGTLIRSQNDEDREKLTSRILFGSDYTVSLMVGGIHSYNRYLAVFSETEYLTQEEKHRFCCVNPERFLFSGTAQ